MLSKREPRLATGEAGSTLRRTSRGREDRVPQEPRGGAKTVSLNPSLSRLTTVYKQSTTRPAWNNHSCLVMPLCYTSLARAVPPRARLPGGSGSGSG